MEVVTEGVMRAETEAETEAEAETQGGRQMVARHVAGRMALQAPVVTVRVATNQMMKVDDDENAMPAIGTCCGRTDV